jgi:hypothetical protein
MPDDLAPIPVKPSGTRQWLAENRPEDFSENRSLVEAAEAAALICLLKQTRNCGDGSIMLDHMAASMCAERLRDEAEKARFAGLLADYLEGTGYRLCAVPSGANHG